MEHIQTTIRSIREQIANGADAGVIDSALNRLEKQFNAMSGNDTTDQNKPNPAEAFWNKKARNERFGKYAVKPTIDTPLP